MNPYQIMGVIAICASLFAGVVAFLAMQGMPVLIAFICVYVVAIWFMLSLQRRARQAAEGSARQRTTNRKSNAWQLSPSSNALVPNEEERRRERRFGA